MKILDGKKIKEEILDELRNEVDNLQEKPTLVVIQVGNNEASNVYINQKEKMAQYVGFKFHHIKFEDTITEDELLKEIAKLNEDNSVNGILVQMPLPSNIDVNKIQNAIDPEKDVDGLSDINTGKLFHAKDALYSCTPNGIMELLKRYNISVVGKHVVVVGRSNLVGKPMMTLLVNEGATVTICHSKTIDLAKYTRDADILIVAVGKPKLITANMVKEGAIVIDVGINRLENRLCGDADYENVLPKCSYITPVPGGVGPMTVAMLGMNVLKAYKIQKEK